MVANPYARLMRLHQPTGIWLLLLPCWWSVALASHGFPSPWLLALFGIGAVVMRGAGCIVNDMADREFDRQVERTKSRPLASGELTMKQAFRLLFILLSIALLIAIQMNLVVFALAVSSLLLVAVYPFMKRVTWWPQLFLGFTFNWGALMGWAAVRGEFDLPAQLLYAGGVFWTLGYDTIYAHQDKKDDIVAGVKSTALHLGEDTKIHVGIFYGCATLLWGVAMAVTHGTLSSLCILPVAAHFIWQIKTVNLDEPVSCMRIFRSNRGAGIAVLTGIVAAGI